VYLEQNDPRMRRGDTARMLRYKLDELRIDACEIVRLPVIAPALGLRRVEQALHLRVRPPRHGICNGLAHFAQPADQRFARLDLARVTDKNRDNRFAVYFFRQPRRRRRVAQDRDARELARCRGAELAIRFEDLPGFLTTPDDRPAQYFGAD